MVLRIVLEDPSGPRGRPLVHTKDMTTCPYKRETGSSESEKVCVDRNKHHRETEGAVDVTPVGVGSSHEPRKADSL